MPEAFGIGCVACGGFDVWGVVFEVAIEPGHKKFAEVFAEHASDGGGHVVAIAVDFEADDHFSFEFALAGVFGKLVAALRGGFIEDGDVRVRDAVG